MSKITNKSKKREEVRHDIKKSLIKKDRNKYDRKLNPTGIEQTRRCNQSKLTNKTLENTYSKPLRRKNCQWLSSSSSENTDLFNPSNDEKSVNQRGTYINEHRLKLEQSVSICSETDISRRSDTFVINENITYTKSIQQQSHTIGYQTESSDNEWESVIQPFSQSASAYRRSFYRVKADKRKFSDGTLSRFNLQYRAVESKLKVPLVEVDIFAPTSPNFIYSNELRTTKKSITESSRKLRRKNNQNLDVNMDDLEGYYNFSMGEKVDGRYEVFEAYGRGVFSTVLRARDNEYARLSVAFLSYDEVAIKVIRANEKMSRAAKLERILLSKLTLTGSDNKHVISLIGHFKYNYHFCLVFEPMDMNLRTCIKKFGRNIGLNILAVRTYTIQLLLSLRHLKNNGVLHADIKPDNILIDKVGKLVKICDLGSAMLIGDIEITPYLVSRFYRPPEVILGLPYDTSMDMWSVGCVIYELFTGQILFPGKSNNMMVKQIMDVKGPVPKKILRKGAFTERHFDLSNPSTPFCYIDEDPVTKNQKIRKFSHISVKSKFVNLFGGIDGISPKATKLADLLERMMMIDPDKRISINQALKHPFCDLDEC